MKKILLLSAVALLLAGCGSKGPKEITPEQYGEKVENLVAVEYKTATAVCVYKETNSADFKETSKFTFDSTEKVWLEDGETESGSNCLEYLGFTAKAAYDKYLDEYKNYKILIPVRTRYSAESYKFYDDLSIVIKYSYDYDYNGGGHEHGEYSVSWNFNSDGVLIKYERSLTLKYTGFEDETENGTYFDYESFTFTYAK